MEYQEPQEFLQVWGIQACGQWEFWGLLATCQCPTITGAAAVTGEQSLWAAWALGPVFWHRFLRIQYSSCCWHRGIKLSVTCGAAGSMGPAYTGVPISLEFQNEGSRSCRKEEHVELQVPLCARKEDLPPSVAMQQLQGQGIRNAELWVVLPILPMILLLLVDLEKALFLAGYGTLWVPFGAPWSSFFRVVSRHWDIGMSTIHHLWKYLEITLNVWRMNMAI
jgi:hypothetical protein